MQTIGVTDVTITCSGPGKLYLASPYVVAASAIVGKIVEPFEFLRKAEEALVEV